MNSAIYHKLSRWAGLTNTKNGVWIPIFFFKIHFYLQGRNRVSSIRWFIPQTPSSLKAKPGAQNSTHFSYMDGRNSRTQVLKPSPAAFRDVHMQETRMGSWVRTWIQALQYEHVSLKEYHNLCAKYTPMYVHSIVMYLKILQTWMHVAY